VRKFDRNYYLAIQKTAPSDAPVEFLEVPNELTVQFDIKRHSFGDSNYAQIKIYNLSRQSANSILKTDYDFNLMKQVIFQAGYGDGPSWPLLFTGNCSTVKSVREGNNYVTTIEAFDAGFAYSNAKLPVPFTSPEGATRQSLITQMAKTLATPENGSVQLGAIGTAGGYLLDSIPKGNSYTGNPLNLIAEMTGGFGTNLMFVDQNRLHVLDKLHGEVIQTPTVPKITASSGLLGTPVRESNMLYFDTLLESNLLVGQQIFLDAQTVQNYNTNYIVISLQHKGTISKAVCAEAITSIGVFCTTLTPIPLPVAS